ncbi:MAG TPA: hypothetical protein VMQ10_13630 [Spirochaetia bacterium]|nr:hypothetical protein [Spirochaetia bacterium]
MAVHLYLSTIPEALIASMLDPLDFGAYYAVGQEKKSRGQAQFFSVDRGFSSDYFPMSEIDKRCVPHPDGKPKNSVYLSVYRALEHVPISAIGNLYLTTRDGRVLEIAPSKDLPAFPSTYRMYQELCPVVPRVVSRLDPREFVSFLTDPKRSIHVPKIFFAELALGELADNPDTGSIRDLPYPNIEHLRACVAEVKKDSHKGTKTVDRMAPTEFPYRTIQHGFFLGDQKEVKFYPMPTERELQTTHYVWWRSALG